MTRREALDAWLTAVDLLLEVPPVTLRMADGPVANLPAGLDAYAGYVDRSGIGVTYPAVVAAHPAARHLSISVHGAPADCGDVENGALTSWTGYRYGYCAVSQVNTLVRRDGRPQKLWTAHYDPAIGAHICSPACWPGLVTTADATQWTTHGNRWDESLLLDNFFAPVAPAPASTLPTPPPQPRGAKMLHTVNVATDPQGNGWVETTIPWAAFESATAQGNYPPVDGYSKPWQAKAQDRDNMVLIEVVAAAPSSHVTVFVTATA